MSLYKIFWIKIILKSACVLQNKMQGHSICFHFKGLLFHNECTFIVQKLHIDVFLLKLTILKQLKIWHINGCIACWWHFKSLRLKITMKHKKWVTITCIRPFIYVVHYSPCHGYNMKFCFHLDACKRAKVCHFNTISSSI